MSSAAATHEQIRVFWADVRAQRLTDVHGFLKRFPDTVGMWRDAANTRQFAQVILSNTGMTLSGSGLGASVTIPDVACAPLSAAVLFMHGVDFELTDMPDLLRAVFGECASELPPDLYERLLKKVDTWMHKHVGRAELVMVACSQTRNLDGFRRAMGASGCSKRGAPILDDTPQRVPGMSVLQAVLLWEDVKLRHELLTLLLPKCTLAYVLLDAPVHAEPGSCIAPVAQARTVFEEAAAVPDADALQMLLNECVKYGVLNDAAVQRVLTAALQFCGNMATYVTDVQILDDVIVKLCAHLRVEHIAACFASLASTYEGAVSRTLARYADTKAHAAFAHADTAQRNIVRAMALCTSMVKHARTMAERDVQLMTTRTAEESKRFQTALAAELVLAERAHALDADVQVLRVKSQVMSEIIMKQARALHYVQDQARGVSAPVAVLSDSKFSEFVTAMDALEADLLSVSMPAVEGVVALPAPFVAPGTSLETRFESIKDTAMLQALQTRLRAIREPVGMLA